MRDDQTCATCEWWDTRYAAKEVDPGVQLNPCLRWPGSVRWLHTGGDQRCWQWCARGKAGHNPPWEKDADAIDPWHKADLEAAAQLVLEAGGSTGHANNCAELVKELLRDREELGKEAAALTKERLLLQGKTHEARRLLELRVRHQVKDENQTRKWYNDVRAWLKEQP